MSIRRAGMNDVNQIVDIGRMFSVESEFSSIVPFCEASFRATVESLVNNQNSIVLVLDENSKCLGMIAAVIYPHYTNCNYKIGQELFWYVLPEKRNSIQSIKLLKHAEQWAIDNNANAMIMVCLGNGMNDRLSSFYEGRGYKKAETSFIKRLS